MRCCFALQLTTSALEICSIPNQMQPCRCRQTGQPPPVPTAAIAHAARASTSVIGQQMSPPYHQAWHHQSMLPSCFTACVGVQVIRGAVRNESNGLPCEATLLQCLCSLVTPSLPRACVCEAVTLCAAERVLGVRVERQRLLPWKPTRQRPLEQPHASKQTLDNTGDSQQAKLAMGIAHTFVASPESTLSHLALPVYAPIQTTAAFAIVDAPGRHRIADTSEYTNTSM